MKKAALILLAFLIAPTLAAQPIRFPTEPVPAPVVIPAPKPVNEPFKLTGENVFVVEGDVEFLLLATPKNLVKITKHVGPMTIIARFADGDGTLQERPYKGRVIYLVKAAGVGLCDLAAVPSEAIVKVPASDKEQTLVVKITEEKDVIRRTIAVDNGQGPRPPPKPDDPPVPPTPTDPYFPLDGKTRVLMVYDSNQMDKLSAGQLAAIEGTAVRKWLDDHCPLNGYRIWPSTVKGIENTPAEWQKAFAKAQASKTPLPYLLVSNGKGVETIQALPTDDTLPLLKKVGGE